jgi:hypothetical protein
VAEAVSPLSSFLPFQDVSLMIDVIAFLNSPNSVFKAWASLVPYVSLDA